MNRDERPAVLVDMRREFWLVSFASRRRRVPLWRPVCAWTFGSPELCRALRVLFLKSVTIRDAQTQRTAESSCEVRAMGPCARSIVDRSPATTDADLEPKEALGFERQAVIARSGRGLSTPPLFRPLILVSGTWV